MATAPRSKDKGHDKSLFEHFSSTVRTDSRYFKDVLRSHRIRPGDAIKEMIEKDFRVFRIAVLAKRNEALCLSQHCRSDEYDDLLFGGQRPEVRHTIIQNALRSLHINVAKSGRKSMSLLGIQRNLWKVAALELASIGRWRTAAEYESLPINRRLATSSSLKAVGNRSDSFGSIRSSSLIMATQHLHEEEAQRCNASRHGLCRQHPLP